MDGEAPVSELALPFDMSLAAVSKHIKVLERADLVQQRKEGRQRLCSMREAPLRDAAAVIAHYRTFWNRRLDALEAHLSQTKKAKPR
jgi:DNA-binding transcriptional ArsR family regulator